jgi:subtilase family serine protease
MEETMRYPLQVIRYFSLVGALGALLAGCSTHSGTALTPVSGSQSRGVGSVDAYPISLESYPISLEAYPSSVGAIPISAQAFPVCASTNGKGSCGILKRAAQSKIPPGQAKKYIAGYQPQHLQGAYGLTTASASQGTGRIVAIVTTGVDATIDSDLSVYRSTMGLPACTVANGCLQIVNASNAPTTVDPAWSEETALDTEMVSAICPLCSIVVVVANTSNVADLGKAVALAATYQPVSISNSYAVPEASDNAGYASNYNQPGIAVVAGAGDSGFGVNFPASLPNVIAVGGTSLTQDNSTSKFKAQTVWAGTGSGCSAFFKKPNFQHDAGGAGRAANDLAVVADPQTGVAGYSSYGNGWNVYGGTSVSAPIVAAMYALAGHSNSDASSLYANANASNFAWIFGSNGACSPSYLCTAQGQSYNGPAGVGVPFGLGGF